MTPLSLTNSALYAVYFMATTIGFIMVSFLLRMYPLHGKYLNNIQRTLEMKRGTVPES